MEEQIAGIKISPQQDLSSLEGKHAGQKVRIRLVGVPVDGLLDGTVKRWWPLPAAASVSPRVGSGADQRGAG